MLSQFEPVDRQLREREIRCALGNRGLRGDAHLLRATTVQSTYRVDLAKMALIVRWRDHRDPMDAVNAEREVLGVLRAAGISRIPEWQFCESTPNGTVSAVSFLPGQSLKGIPPVDLAARIGRLLASIHDAVRSADLDVGTAWDANRIRYLWEEASNELSIPDALTRFVESALARFVSLEETARFQPGLWGVIHSDLNASNVIISDNEPGVIDFAEAGPGFFAWDVVMLPFDQWWDYGHEAEAAGSSLIHAYVSAGGVKPTSEMLRICAEARIVETATWNRPSLGVPISRCHEWIEEVLDAVSRLNKSAPAWMT